LRGESGLAVGNAVGSVMCIIGLVLGTTAALKEVNIRWRSLLLPLSVMLASGVILLIVTLDLELNRGQGAALLVIGAGYFTWDFIRAWRDRKPAEVAEAMLGVMLMLVWMLRTDKRLSRREGAALLAYYAIYLAFLVVLTPRGGGL